MMSRLPMKEDRPKRPKIYDKLQVRGVDVPWSRHEGAWHKEEVAPCGDAGGLVFGYSRYSGYRPVPDLSDILVARPRPWILVLWEPLITKAPSPPKVQPHCCYINTVIFYHSPHIVWPFPRIYHWNGRFHPDSGPTFLQWDQIETRLCQEDIVRFDGDRFDIGLGRVVWKAGRWWMRHGARRKTEDQ